MPDFIKAIAKGATAEIKTQSSRFIGITYQIQSESDVKQLIGSIRKEHYSATHHCYAYRFFDKTLSEKFSDDGEPNGTAGAPILNQIKAADLTNCLCIVIRYYGGIKLGSSGLIKAYGETAKEAILNSELIDIPIRESISLHAKFSDLAIVKKILKPFDVEIIENYDDEGCNFTIMPLSSEYEKIYSILKNIHTLKF